MWFNKTSTGCSPDFPPSTVWALLVVAFLAKPVEPVNVYVFLEPQGQPIYKWMEMMEMMISNHFLVIKVWNHHPIEFQPFINGWPWGSRCFICFRNQFNMMNIPMICRVSYMPGDCLGFLFHQQILHPYQITMPAFRERRTSVGPLRKW